MTGSQRIFWLEYSGTSVIFALDGSSLAVTPWPVLQGRAFLEGASPQEGRLTGKAHIMGGDLPCAERPAVGASEDMPHRARIAGAVEMTLFDDGTGTLEGVCPAIHEAFGSAAQILSKYPWAEPSCISPAMGWWIVALEIRIYRSDSVRLIGT
jgi:hypothetical protein